MRGTTFRFRRYLVAVGILAASFCFPLTGVAQAGKGKPAVKPAVAATQVNNEEYTAKIREYTTEKFFLTELVDHLPASDKVPSPDKVIGYVIGTPDKLTYTKDVNRYMRELEKASPRVKVFSIGQFRRRTRDARGGHFRRSNHRQARSDQGDQRQARGSQKNQG